MKELKGLRQLMTEEEGMGTVEVILIIVVLVGLVLIFKKQITDMRHFVHSHSIVLVFGTAGRCAPKRGQNGGGMCYGYRFAEYIGRISSGTDEAV